VSDVAVPSRSLAGEHFVTTRWSVVLAAQDASAPEAATALETLCRTYWYPLYAYVRSTGRTPADAEDLTQEFFARLLAHDWLKAIAPEKGRFRAFLLMAVKRFLAKEWRREQAQKRGGGNRPLPLDTTVAESRFAAEPPLSPDELYERRWALMLLEQALEQLHDEFRRAARQPEFDVLKPWLGAGRGDIPYADLAVRLATTEGAARVAVHRLRKRFREVFRQTIAQTVAGADDVEAEVRHLMSVLSRG
jgi:RNA polymerase sigma-70 factor (ECF subfamily)